MLAETDYNLRDLNPPKDLFLDHFSCFGSLEAVYVEQLRALYQACHPCSEGLKLRTFWAFEDPGRALRMYKFYLDDHQIRVAHCRISQRGSIILGDNPKLLFEDLLEPLNLDRLRPATLFAQADQPGIILNKLVMILQNELLDGLMEDFYPPYIQPRWTEEEFHRALDLFTFKCLKYPLLMHRAQVPLYKGKSFRDYGDAFHLAKNYGLLTLANRLEELLHLKMLPMGVVDLANGFNLHADYQHTYYLGFLDPQLKSRK